MLAITMENVFTISEAALGIDLQRSVAAAIYYQRNRRHHLAVRVTGPAACLPAKLLSSASMKWLGGSDNTSAP